MSGRWISSIFEAVATAQSLSWSLSCPIHCGSSIIPWFISGLSLGFLLAVIALTFLLWHLGLLPLRQSSPHPPFSSGSPRVSTPSTSRSAARLAGYLHGPDSNSRWYRPANSKSCGPDPGRPGTSCQGHKSGGKATTFSVALGFGGTCKEDDRGLLPALPSSSSWLRSSCYSPSSPWPGADLGHESS